MSERLSGYDKIITVAVDVQNDFCPGGALAVHHGDEVIAPMNAVMDATREAGGVVIATRDWHPENTPHFEAWPVHCVAGTDGAAFHPDLALSHGEDIIVNKGTGQTDGYSGFEGATETGSTIEDLAYPARTPEAAKYKRVVMMIGGLATDYCVLNTALDAAKLRDRADYQLDVVAIIDAMRAVNIHPEDEQKAIDAMRDAGVRFMTSGEILEELEGRHHDRS